MDLFPTEVWIQIVVFSCTDNGSTGRSLSLTCSKLREITKPVGLSSLSLIGAKQIVLFAHALENIPAAERRILNLFVTCSNPLLNPAINNNMQPSLTDALRALSLHDDDYMRPGLTFGSTTTTWSTQLRINEHTISKALYRILDIVSPTLLTLSVHIAFITRPVTLLPISLPVLTELTLHGPFNVGANAPVQPKLKRLHLAALYPKPPASFMQHVGRQAPALTHLMLSQSVTSHDQVQELREISHSIDDYWLSRETGLQWLLVEVDLSLKADGGAIWLQELMDIADSNPRLIIFRQRQAWLDAFSAEKDWQERIRGREGRWIVSSF